MVENTAHNFMIKGWNPATGTSRDKVAFMKICLLLASSGSVVSRTLDNPWNKGSLTEQVASNKSSLQLKSILQNTQALQLFTIIIKTVRAFDLTQALSLYIYLHNFW
jgi:hypothetical protein